MILARPVTTALRIAIVCSSLLLASACAQRVTPPPGGDQPPSYHPHYQEATSQSASAPSVHSGHAAAVGASPAPQVKNSFGELLEGNRRFVYGKSIHPRQSLARRVELAGGQQPHTIVFSCSDSRVPPEVVFDQGVGDLFVVRTAGETPDAAAVASIEYAIEHLGAKSLVIMGHMSCGAVKAALTTSPGKSAGSKDLDALVASIRPNLRGLSDAERSPTLSPTLAAAAMAQARGVRSQLLARSHIIKEAIEHGGLKIYLAIYHLDTGEAEFFS